MSNLVRLPEYYWEGYVLMNANEDILDYTQFDDIVNHWRMFGEHGRKIAKIIIYDQEDVE